MGAFSTSNHTKLLEIDHGVPIYAADVGKTLRLVYHIDFGAPTHSTLESQCTVPFNPRVDVFLLTVRKSHSNIWDFFEGRD